MSARQAFARSTPAPRGGSAWSLLGVFGPGSQSLMGGGAMRRSADVSRARRAWIAEYRTMPRDRAPLAPTSRPLYTPHHDRQLRGLIGLGAIGGVAAAALLRRDAPRKRNIAAADPCFEPSRVEYPGFEYRGNFRGWHGSRAAPKIQNYGTISHDGSAVGYIVTMENLTTRNGYILAPTGYRWEIVHDVIALVRNRDGAEYHPTGDDMIQGARHIRGELIRMADRRAALAARVVHTIGDADGARVIIYSNGRAELKIDKAAARRVVATLADSLRAGNCEAGSRAFLARIGVTPAEIASGLPISTLIERVGAASAGLSQAWIQRFYQVVIYLLNRDKDHKTSGAA